MIELFLSAFANPVGCLVFDLFFSFFNILGCNAFNLPTLWDAMPPTNSELRSTHLVS